MRVVEECEKLKLILLCSFIVLNIQGEKFNIAVMCYTSRSVYTKTQFPQSMCDIHSLTKINLSVLNVLIKRITKTIILTTSCVKFV